MKDLRKDMDRRFEHVNRRFEDMDKRFTLLTWMIGLGFSVVVALSTIFKLFG